MIVTIWTIVVTAININTTDTSTNGFYVIMFTSGAYTLQENTTIDGQIIVAGELVVKEKYLCSMKIDTNWYCNQQPKHHVITVPTRTILHPKLEVSAITDFHAIPAGQPMDFMLFCSHQVRIHSRKIQQLMDKF